MKVKVNGRETELGEIESLEQALIELSVETRYLAVALNGVCVPQGDFGRKTLHEKDEIEILAPQAGG